MCSNFDNVKPKPPKVDVREYAGLLHSGQLGDIDTVHAWPKRDAWVIRLDQNAADRRFESWLWSLVPFWSKELDPKITTFNARSETVYKMPAYRGPWRHGRCCLIP